MATSTIKPKCGTTAQWAASGRILEVNEWGVEVTENGKYILRIGDGEHRFHELEAVVDTPALHELAAHIEESHGKIAGYNETAATAAGNAAASASQAKSALQGVQNALDNLPAGDTLVINLLGLRMMGLKLNLCTIQLSAIVIAHLLAIFPHGTKADKPRHFPTVLG